MKHWLMHRQFLAIVPIVVGLQSPLFAAQQRTIVEDDLRSLVGVSSPVIAPDGRHAVVLVSRIAWDDDRRDSELVMIDLTTHAQRTLTYHRTGLGDPSFSPDGTRLAFLADEGSDKEARRQVFVLPLSGGDAHPVTNAKDGVEQYTWRPDGRAIAYAAADPLPDRKGADRFRDSFIFTTEPITDRDRPQPVHLFVTQLSGGTATQLTFGSQSVVSGEAESTISWSPDGSTIAFTIAPNAILNDESASRVAVLNVTTHQLHYLTGHTAWESNPLFSPDGKWIAYAYSKGDDQVNLVDLYVTTPGGGEGKVIGASIDRTVRDFAWSPDSKSLLVTVPDATTKALYREPLSGPAQRVDIGDLAIASGLDGAIGKDGALLFVASSTKQPSELFYRGPNASAVKLTDFNATIANLQLGDSQQITFPTSLGITGDAVLVTPPGFTPARKYPLVVYIHGGPTSSSMRAFDFYAQVMAARGWLVLRPNYRGSDNLGLAYQRAVLYDPEEGPGKDIMAALDAVRSRGIVDDRHIAVSGWSYGGIMTAWMISRYHIWSAAVSGASVDDWATDYGVADDSLSDMDLFHGSPYVAGNAEEWRRASAITYASDVTTSVLILSDVGDNRDPFATSSMYWRALRDNHKDATLRVWPVDGHFPDDPVRTADVYHYWIDFIAQHFQ
jgi:dipeptidyl aminopeptidase/acylaminoacyl peptidase